MTPQSDEEGATTMIAATVIGNLGTDAEFKVLQDGTGVIELRVASNSREKIGGEWKDVPTWCRVALFGKRAESLAKLGLSKGTKIAARGSMKLREYEKREGGTGYSLEMRADDIELLGSKDGPQKGTAPRAQSHDDGDDHLPF
jgi:single-strand DNA-binding protein